jgi:N-acyl-phosphatidylethanolamine-hydrolysing phospholipase D
VSDSSRSPFRRPAVRDADGRFAHPWPVAGEANRGFGALLRWQAQRLRSGRSATPEAHEFHRARPAIALPRAAPGEARLTWVGHATFLVQIDGMNILTDPVWSRRASPLQWAGPTRITEPGIPLDVLPPIDAVFLSHDHYDHLDVPTVRALHARHGDTVSWITPLGYAAWLRRLGIRNVTELDWWEHAAIHMEAGVLNVRALPAQHWTRRTPLDERRRLWASFSLRAGDGPAIYFCGDSGYFAGFREIAEAEGPFAACMLPIGAYDPRWFMKPAHMSPEEAVRAYLDLGGTGTFTGMHWGTFQLTDEPPLEPPWRARTAWQEADLPAADLWLPMHGETRLLQPR